MEPGGVDDGVAAVTEPPLHPAGDEAPLSVIPVASQDGRTGSGRPAVADPQREDDGTGDKGLAMVHELVGTARVINAIAVITVAPVQAASVGWGPGRAR